MSRTNLRLATSQNSLLPTFSDIYSVIEFLVKLGTLAAFIIGIIRIHPKGVPNAQPVFPPYIDSTSDQMVEEIEYYLSWGHVWRKRIRLPRFPRHSQLQIFYKPVTSYKRNLPPDQYEETAKGNHRTIVIVNKAFFDNAEAHSVFVQNNSLADPSYRERVHPKNGQSCITIENTNRDEIRNYPIDLPSNVTLADLGPLLEQIAEFETSEAQGSKKIRATVRKIPAMQGDVPGVVVISWRSTSVSPS